MSKQRTTGVLFSGLGLAAASCLVYAGLGRSGSDREAQTLRVARSRVDAARVQDAEFADRPTPVVETTPTGFDEQQLAVWREAMALSEIGFIERIEGHASHVGVTCERIDLVGGLGVDSTDAQGAVNAPRGVFVVSGTGSPEAIACFLERLETDPPLSVIRGMRVWVEPEVGTRFAVDVAVFSEAIGRVARSQPDGSAP